MQKLLLLHAGSFSAIAFIVTGTGGTYLRLIPMGRQRVFNTNLTFQNNTNFNKSNF